MQNYIKNLISTLLLSIFCSALTPLYAMHNTNEPEADAEHKIAAADVIDQTALMLTSQNMDDTTAFHRAAFLGQKAQVEALLHAESLRQHDNAASCIPLIAQKDHHKQTALMLAAHTGHTEIVEILCNHDTQKAYINEQDDTGITALIFAIDGNHFNVATLLLHHNADTAKQLPDGRTALHIAANNGNTEIVEMLCMHDIEKAHINAQDNTGITALMLAAANNHLNIATVLLTHAKNSIVNTSNKEENTALILAAPNDTPDMITLLINHKADISKQGSYGLTALHIAAITGNKAGVQILLAQEDSIDHSAAPAAPLLGIKNQLGQTALIPAAHKGHTEIVEMLCNHDTQKAYINEQDNDGRTALIFAIARNHFNVATLLLHLNADATKQLPNGHTALHIAAASGRDAAVQRLLAQEASVNRSALSTPLLAIKDQEGKTALTLAVKNGHKTIVNMLRTFTYSTAHSQKHPAPIIINPQSDALRTIKEQNSKKLVQSLDGFRDGRITPEDMQHALDKHFALFGADKATHQKALDTFEAQYPRSFSQKTRNLGKPLATPAAQQSPSKSGKK